MFLSETHHPQLLDSCAYHSEQFFGAEQKSMFEPAWHCVGTLDQLGRDGDFITYDLLKRPIIVWNKAGELRGFLNVCAHRFSRLTDKPCGHAERLTCQYHGWQYDEQGDTQKLPDAQSFRPLQSGQLGLTKLQVETCGKLVFVRLRQDDSKLETQLGTGFSAVQELFGPKRKLVFERKNSVAANWKVVIENAIESYHVACVHSNSFGLMPAADACTHQLNDEFTKFETNSPSQAPQILQAGERFIHRLTGFPYVERYQQFHFYPNMMVSTSKFISVLMIVEPIMPSESRFVLRVFGDPGKYSNPAAKAAFWIAARWAQKEVCKVLEEDFAILPSIQKGIESPDQPKSGGLISVREERIFHFQSKVKQAVENGTL